MKAFLLVGVALGAALISSCSRQYTSSSEPVTVAFDFENKQFDKEHTDALKNLKNGDMFQLQIDNINMNLYNVSVGSIDSVYESNVALPSVELIGLSSISDLLSSIVGSLDAVSAPTGNDQLDQLQSTVRHLKTDLLQTQFAYQAEKSFREYSSKMKHGFYEQLIPDTMAMGDTGVFEDKIDRLKNEITQIEGQIEALLIALNKTKNTRQKVIQGTEKYTTSLYVEGTRVSESLLEVNALMRLIQLSPFTYLSGQYGETNPDASKKLNELTFLLEMSQRLNAKLNGHYTSVHQLQNQYSRFIDSVLMDTNKQKVLADTFIKKRQADLATGFSVLKNSIQNALTAVNSDTIVEQLLALMNLENNASRTYLSMPIQLNGDAKSLSLQITPKDTKSGLQSYSGNYLFPTPKFYSGLSLGYYYAFGLNNQEFSVVETRGTDTTYSLVEENQSKGEAGFNALLHAGFNPTRGAWGMHVSMGPGVSFGTKSQFRMAAGLGSSWGSKHGKLTVDALFMTGYVMQLSNAYTLDYSSTAKPSQVTVSKRQSSLALSIGYMYKF